MTDLPGMYPKDDRSSVAQIPAPKRSEAAVTQEQQQEIDYWLAAVRLALVSAVEAGRSWKGQMTAEDHEDKPVEDSKGKKWGTGHLTGKVSITIDIEAYSQCPKCGKDHRGIILDTTSQEEFLSGRQRKLSEGKQ